MELDPGNAFARQELRRLKIPIWKEMVSSLSRRASNGSRLVSELIQAGDEQNRSNQVKSACLFSRAFTVATTEESRLQALTRAARSLRHEHKYQAVALRLMRDLYDLFPERRMDATLRIAFNFGAALQVMNYTDEAIQVLQPLIDADSEDVWSHFYIGRAFRDAGDDLVALQHFVRVIEISRARNAAQSSWCFRHMEKVEASIVELRDALVAERCKAAMKAGRAKLGRAERESYAVVSDEDRRRWAHVVETYLDQDEPDNAMVRLYEIGKATDDEWTKRMVIFQIGRCLKRIGELDFAEVIFRSLTACHPEWPENVESLFQLGAISRSKGHVDEAISLFEHALESKPEHAWSRYLLGKTLQECGEYAAALEHFEIVQKIGEQFGAHNDVEADVQGLREILGK